MLADEEGANHFCVIWNPNGDVLWGFPKELNLDAIRLWLWLIGSRELAGLPSGALLSIPQTQFLILAIQVKVCMVEVFKDGCLQGSKIFLWKCWRELVIERNAYCKHCYLISLALQYCTVIESLGSIRTEFSLWWYCRMRMRRSESILFHRGCDSTHRLFRISH